MDQSASDQSQLKKWGQALLIALLVQTGSFLLYSPALWNPPSLRFTDQYAPLAENPWRSDLEFNPQGRHRILGPVIAHYLGLRGLWAEVPPIAANTFFLAVALLILQRLTAWRTSVVLLALLATTQTVVSSQTWIGFQDSFGHLAIAICLLVGRPWLALPVIILGMLGDERCATALPFVILWHFVVAEERPYLRASLWTIAGLAAVAIWFGLFKWIQSTFVPETAKAALNWNEVVSFRYLAINLNYIPLGMYEAFRAAWILPIMMVPLLVRQRRWLVLAGFLLALAICVIQASLVADISRCCAFGWPGLFIAIYFLSKYQPVVLDQVSKFALVLNVFTPSYQIIGGEPLRSPQLYWPFPLALLRLFSGV